MSCPSWIYPNGVVVAGRCIPRLHHPLAPAHGWIQFSIPFIEANDEKVVVSEIIKHEIAHALGGCDHGPMWAEVHRKMGGSGIAQPNLVVPAPISIVALGLAAVFNSKEASLVR